MFDEFVLAAATADLSEASLAREHADAVEFRMDLTENPLEQLDDYDEELPIIATNRAEWEGGEATELGRLDDLAEAVVTDPVTAVDVELAALDGTAPESKQAHATALRETADGEGVTVIASVHDFESTPPRARLAELLEDAVAAGDIAKLATTADGRSDALAMLEATHEATEAGLDVATMCMGEPGRHTRAVAPLYGSKIGYAPVDPAAATAPGQYALATLDGLVDRLAGP